MGYSPDLSDSHVIRLAGLESAELAYIRSYEVENMVKIFSMCSNNFDKNKVAFIQSFMYCQKAFIARFSKGLLN